MPGRRSVGRRQRKARRCNRPVSPRRRASLPYSPPVHGPGALRRCNRPISPRRRAALSCRPPVHGPGALRRYNRPVSPRRRASLPCRPPVHGPGALRQCNHPSARVGGLHSRVARPFTGRALFASATTRQPAQAGFAPVSPARSRAGRSSPVQPPVRPRRRASLPYSPPVHGPGDPSAYLLLIIDMHEPRTVTNPIHQRELHFW